MREVVSASIGHPTSPSQLDFAIPVTSPTPDRAEAEGAIGQTAGDGLMTRPDISTAPVSHLAVAPPAVAQHQSADWGLVEAEQVDVIRHEPFQL
jgi:hypothetical protein